jgi:hypothetical protein
MINPNLKEDLMFIELTVEEEQALREMYDAHHANDEEVFPKEEAA